MPGSKPESAWNSTPQPLDADPPQAGFQLTVPLPAGRALRPDAAAHPMGALREFAAELALTLATDAVPVSGGGNRDWGAENGGFDPCE